MRNVIFCCDLRRKLHHDECFSNDPWIRSTGLTHSAERRRFGAGHISKKERAREKDWALVETSKPTRASLRDDLSSASQTSLPDEPWRSVRSRGEAPSSRGKCQARLQERPLLWVESWRRWSGCAGDVDGHHGWRRDGARQAQLAFPHRSTRGSTGSHNRRREFLVRGAEQGRSGLSTRPEERSPEGDRDRLCSQGWRLHQRIFRCPQTDWPRPVWPTGLCSTWSRRDISRRCRSKRWCNSDRHKPHLKLLRDESRWRLDGRFSRRDGGTGVCSNSWSRDPGKLRLAEGSRDRRRHAIDPGGGRFYRDRTVQRTVEITPQQGKGDIQIRPWRINEKGTSCENSLLFATGSTQHIFATPMRILSLVFHCLSPEDCTIPSTRSCFDRLQAVDLIWRHFITSTQGPCFACNPTRLRSWSVCSRDTRLHFVVATRSTRFALTPQSPLSHSTPLAQASFGSYRTNRRVGSYFSRTDLEVFFFLRASHHVLMVYEKPHTNLFLYLVSFVPYLVTSALIPSMCSENNSTSSSSLSSARPGRAFMITNVAKP